MSCKFGRLHAVSMLALMTGMAGFTTPALAQTTSSTALEEVVVTAQRRTENLQDVPIAVQAVTAAGLEANGIQNTRDVQFTVPSLVYGHGSVFAQPYLRGIGTDLTAPNADPSVATYRDGVYIASTTGVVQQLLGVDRIEVLLGPQGTLYGRNATGGAINVYSLTPTSELEAEVKATYGNYDRKELSGRLSGGTDTFAAGVYFAFSERDTYLTKMNPAVNDRNFEKSAAARLKAVWTPTDAIKITGLWERARHKGIESTVLRNIQPNALGYALGAPTTIKNYHYDSDVIQPNSPGHVFWYVRGDVDLGFAQFVSLTARNNLLAGRSQDDVDGTRAQIASSIAWPIRSKHWSQEFQLLAPADSKIQWITGAYYFFEHSAFDDVATLLGPILTGGPAGGAWRDSHVKTTSFAGFAQATVPLDFINENLRLTAGARYTVDKKKLDSTGYFALGYYCELDQRNCFTPVPGTFAPFPHQEKKWKKFTPKITLDYKFDDTMIYGTYSVGYKGGAFNVSTPSLLGPVNPETLKSWEIGSKSQFMGGRIRLNTAAYLYKFKNVQVQRVDVGAGGATTWQNAAAATAKGIEVNFQARAHEYLTLNAAVAWAHGKYDDFTGAASVIINPAAPPSPNAAAIFNASGNRMIRMPDWTITGGAAFEYPMANGAKVNATANIYYNDGFFWEPTNRFKQKSYTLINATVGYTFPGEKITLSAWGRNIGNSYYNNFHLLVPFGTLVNDGEPRMYGVTATFKY